MLVAEKDVVCSMCHREFDGDHSQPVNVCPDCSNRTHKIRIPLTCSRCKHTFQTQIRIEDRSRYTSNWVCPACSSNETSKLSRKARRREDRACPECKVDRGICFYPDTNCSRAVRFVPFNSTGLYSVRKENTILSINKVVPTREDIHCMNYTLLYQSGYLLSPNNTILIKQRIGSRKHFITNVMLYKYCKEKSKFVVVFDKNFDRGVNWVVAVRNFLLGKRKNGR